RETGPTRSRGTEENRALVTANLCELVFHLVAGNQTSVSDPWWLDGGVVRLIKSSRERNGKQESPRGLMTSFRLAKSSSLPSDEIQPGINFRVNQHSGLGFGFQPLMNLCQRNFMNRYVFMRHTTTDADAT